MQRIDDLESEGKSFHQARAESQRDFLLKLLREAGPAGISKLHFLQGSGPCRGRLITQVSARIVELEAENYRFEHRRVDGTSFVTFVLLEEPTPQRSAPENPAQQPGSGQLRFDIDSHEGDPNSAFLKHETGLDFKEFSR